MTLESAGLGPEAVAAPLRATSPRKAAAFRAALTVTFAAGAVVFTRFVHLPGFSMCAFKIWTGRACPGCGMTRSIVQLAAGEVAESFRFHPLGLVLAAGAGAVTLGGTWGAATGRDPVWRFFERRGALLALGFVAALVSLWVLRTFVVPDWSPDPIGPSVFSSQGSK